MQKIIILFIIALTIFSCQNNRIVKEERKRGYLGLIFEECNDKDIRKNIPKGIIIMDVIPDSPACEAEIPVYGILSSINGEKIYNTEQAQSLIDSFYTGDILTLTITKYSHQKSKDYIVTLEDDNHQLEKYYSEIYKPNVFKKYEMDKKIKFWEFDFFSDMKSYLTDFIVTPRSYILKFEIHNNSNIARYFSFSKINSNLFQDDFKSVTLNSPIPFQLVGMDNRGVVKIPKANSSNPTIFSFSIIAERPIEYIFFSGQYEEKDQFKNFKKVFQFYDFLSLDVFVKDVTELTNFAKSVPLFPPYAEDQFTAETAKSKIEILTPNLNDNDYYETNVAWCPIKGVVDDLIGIHTIEFDNGAVKKSLSFTIDGEFHYDDNFLEMGKNVITITSHNKKNQQAKFEFTIFRNPEVVHEKKKDICIPFKNDVKNPDDVAIVIGIEKYANIAEPALFCENDAKNMKRYFDATFGLENHNIELYTNQDATKGIFDGIFAEDGTLSRKVNKNSNVYFYYAGHGYVYESSDKEEMSLLPYDANLDSKETGYPLRKVLDRLSKLDVKSRTVILDACYSGISRNGNIFANNTRGSILIREVKGIPNNITLYSSSALNQTSHPYKENKSGLFTYFFLKGLHKEADENSDDLITVNEMKKYLIENIQLIAKRKSFIQTPKIDTNDLEAVLIKYHEEEECPSE